MRTARITAVMHDGTKHEAVGIYMALSDRLDHEEHFGWSIFEKARDAKVEEDGAGTATVEVDKIEEMSHAFFSWCLLRRYCPVEEFDQFRRGLESLSKPDWQDGPADPTDAGLQPGT